MLPLIGGGDPATVLLDDDPGSGKADAEAAGGLGPGGVAPVEPVKELVRRAVRQPVTVVFQLQKELFLLLLQPEQKGAVPGGIFDRIVKQNRN